jgi:hypothetical protein
MWTRERKSIGSTWARITCLDLLLVAQNLGLQVLEGFRDHRLTIATGNKQYKEK